MDQFGNDAWQTLLGDQLTAVYIGGDRPTASRESRLIFPGAFNPLHDGHLQMAAIATEMRGAEVDFELSITNVDKPPLKYADIVRRLRLFNVDHSVWLTNAPTFVDKADLFASATFVVGVDTITRIADLRYYDARPIHRAAAVDRLARANIRFLVFGRAIDGTFQSLAQLHLPPALLAICDEVPEQRFRADISSTELRDR